MKVRLPTIRVPDEYRRALRARAGRKGLATNHEVKEHIDLLISTDIADLTSEFKDSK